MSLSLVASGIGVLVPERGVPVPDDWFDYRTELGRRGYKYLPAASQYLLAATKRAIADAGDSLESTASEARSAAVGTNCAASSLHAGMDRTVIDTDAADLSPAMAPFFSINLFGSRLAIEHGLQGFNLTITSPRVAGLEAVQHGARSIALGRARWLLAGAVESAVDGAEPGAGGSETGAIALVLEPEEAVTARGGRGYGRCQVHTSFLPPSQAKPDRAIELVRAALTSFGLPADAEVPVRAVLDDSRVGEAFDSALKSSALGAAAVPVPAGAGCLEPMAQVVTALADSTVDRQLVVTAAAQGNVAVSLITK